MVATRLFASVRLVVGWLVIVRTAKIKAASKAYWAKKKEPKTVLHSPFQCLITYSCIDMWMMHCKLGT